MLGQTGGSELTVAEVPLFTNSVNAPPKLKPCGVGSRTGLIINCGSNFSNNETLSDAEVERRNPACFQHWQQSAKPRIDNSGSWHFPSN
jgi:hypothetical protein